MANGKNSDVVVYICVNCNPAVARLPRQWEQDDTHVFVRELPCTGKIDVQYLFHAIEGGARGLCVVACPKGECTLAQGNYRAHVRVGTVQRMLAEIGIEPERIELLHCSSEESPEHLRKLIDDAAARFCALGDSPLCQTCLPGSSSTKG